MKIEDDVYGLTIAALITQSCSPAAYLFCLRQVVLVFLFQVAIAIFFGLDQLSFDLFHIKHFTFSHTVLRIICSILLQINLNGELKGATKLMAFLKN